MTLNHSDYLLLNLLNLRSDEIESLFSSNVNGVNNLSVTIKQPTDITCPYCGYSSTVSKGYYQKNIKLANDAFINTPVSVRVPRRYCPGCLHSFSIDKHLTPSNHTVSYDIILKVMDLLQNPDMTFSRAAELTGISERMADLDFSAKYQSGGEDEIGKLGENFNMMSESLEKAMSQLKSANVKLKRDVAIKTQIDERRREFLSNVSHELKTPIALIQGYAEGLKEMELDKESQDMYLDVIVDESQKMNKLVMQLMNLEQIENGSDALELMEFDLTDVIKGVLDNSRIMIEQAGARIIFDESKSFRVCADEFKTEQVVSNYLTNALHHLDGEKIIKITCVRENGVVKTTVFNTGAPIPEESLDKLWNKFYKVDKARTRSYGGSGIGLSIVKAIMEAHGQTCEAKNYENGVAFSFTLEAR